MTQEMTDRPTRDHEASSAEDHEFLDMVETLTELLRQEVRVADRLPAILRRRLRAEALEDLQGSQSAAEKERALLTDIVLVDRERVAALTELGLYLGHRSPSRIRLAELVLYLSPEERDELLELRESLRDVADEVDRLQACSRLFERSRHGRLSVYVSPSILADDRDLQADDGRGAAPAYRDDDPPWWGDDLDEEPEDDQPITSGDEAGPSSSRQTRGG